MKKEVKTIVFDEELCVEAYRFDGVVQPFPNHFHDFYVIGLMEGGGRKLSCKNKEYSLSTGDIVLFNPGDNHRCEQCDGGFLDYRGLNITAEVMERLMVELIGKKNLPEFRCTVIQDEEISCYLRALHESIMSKAKDFSKEENLLLLISAILNRFGYEDVLEFSEKRKEVTEVSKYIEEHFSENIKLKDLCDIANLSKAALLRSFAKELGVTPYLYLQNTRIINAKRLLMEGVPLSEVAALTGFTDQSHFTNYFNSFIGLTPGVFKDLYLKGHSENEK